jgi:hypothetical protein
MNTGWRKKPPANYLAACTAKECFFIFFRGCLMIMRLCEKAGGRHLAADAAK